jgi:hypothetical protein
MYVNRISAVVNLKPPFLEWLNQIPEMVKATEEEIAQHAHVFLLPEDTLNDDETAAQVLNGYWTKIAHGVFNDWLIDPVHWPKDFTTDDFDQWFDLAIIDAPVIDLVEEPLEREEE